MLKLEKFSGNPDADAQRFWKEMKSFLVERNFKNITGNPVPSPLQEVYFYDTKGVCLLYKNNLILRKRIEFENGTFSKILTLKTRSTDRYISGNIKVVNRNSSFVEVKTKFEEDIKPPFQNSFSYSASAEMTSEPNTLRNTSVFFNNIEELDFDFLDKELFPVGGVFTRVYKNMEFSMTDKYSSDIVLTLWFDKTTKKLGIAEFSFKLKDKKEDFDYEVARNAKDFYKDLQEKFSWGDSKSSYKTEWLSIVSMYFYKPFINCSYGFISILSGLFIYNFEFNATFLIYFLSILISIFFENDFYSCCYSMIVGYLIYTIEK
eukprot:gene2158-2023_t